MLQPLEALALASLRDPILVKKRAAVWISYYGNSSPTSGQDILDWVREEFGDVILRGKERAIRLALGNEVKRQLAIRKRRKKDRAGVDVLTLPVTDGARQRALLDRVLGA